MEQNEMLVGHARVASQNAYVPYSEFPVGAAVLCADSTVVVGCNIENASYGLTVCAERVALFSAVSRGKKPVSIAISCVEAEASAEHMPCGACRQVMLELLPANAPVYIDGIGERTTTGLMPDGFSI